jgi:fructose-bisphosphate aldolase class II
MRQLLDEAAKGGYGVGAFNVNDMEQIQAIMMAAKQTKSPVIVQASRGARAFAEDLYLFRLIQAAAELNPDIPIAMHQDHGNSFETCKSAIGLGYTSVMMDGSLKEDGRTPSSFDENVDVTRRVVDYAHERGVTVEGEIGVLGGIEDGHGAGGTGLEHVTDPDQAVEFAERTGVDALAIAIGTSHGAYKFNKKPDGSVLKMDILIAIHKRLPHTHLVMHGSSSVPKDLQDVINQFGGKLKQTWGVPVEEIQLGIRNGVRKINVDTDNRLAITGAIRKVFAETPEKFDPRDYLKPAREAMAKVVAARMTEFGQAGHAGDYQPIPISEMAAGYKLNRTQKRMRHPGDEVAHFCWFAYQSQGSGLRARAQGTGRTILDVEVEAWVLLFKAVLRTADRYSADFHFAWQSDRPLDFLLHLHRLLDAKSHGDIVDLVAVVFAEHQQFAAQFGAASRVLVS